MHTLRAAFASEAYIPSVELGADGWPEARRRQLLKRYLTGRNVRFAEWQEIRQGKYRNTAVLAAGAGDEKKFIVTLSLKPVPNLHSRQLACDQKLLDVLANLEHYLQKTRAVEFTVTETCSDLTPRLHAGE